MSPMRRARKSVRARSLAARASGIPRESVSGPVFDMEEPLREARHLIHVISAIAQYRGEDNEAISTVAGEALRKLNLVETHLRKLFGARPAHHGAYDQRHISRVVRASADPDAWQSDVSATGEPP